MEKCWEFNIDVHQIFVDFKQAYDSIDRTILYHIMLKFGISGKLVLLIKMTMTPYHKYESRKDLRIHSIQRMD